MSHVEIVFDQPSYSPGETLSGRVLFLYKTPTRICNLEMEVTGRARACWTEYVQHTRMTPFDQKSHVEQETYLYKKLRLIEKETIVQPNERIHFSHKLPDGIPSSFFGGWGHVRYITKLKIERPWRLTKKIERRFPVQGRLDLSESTKFSEIDVSNKNPSQLCVKANRSFWDSPIIGIHFKIPRAAYITGESIPVTLNISNGLKTEITGVSLSLIQKNSFIFREFQTTTRKEESEVMKKEKLLDKVNPGQEVVFKSNFEIPIGIPPTNLGGGRIIELEYLLRLSVDAKLFLDSVESFYKIVIGTAWAG